MITQNQNENDLNKKLIFGGGELGDCIRNFDWQATSLGPISEWPLTLRTATNLILQSPAPQMILWGQEGIAIYNSAYILFAGNRHPAMLGISIKTSWPETAHLTSQIIETCSQGEALSFSRYPFTVLRNNKPQEIWMDFYCSPILNESGTPAGVLFTIVETTHYILTEKALKESEEQLSRVINGSNEGIWDLNIETDGAFWNDRMFQILGYTREEVDQPGYNFIKKIVHPEDKAKVETAFTQMLQHGSLYDVEYRVLHKHGHYIYLHAKGKPVYNENGKIVGAAGIAIDINERKRTDKALQESEERFSSIFNQSSVGIAEVDLSGKFVLVNDRYCQMVGRSREDLYQMRMQDISHQDDVPGNMSKFQAAVQKGVPFRIEKRYTRPDGTEIWVNNNVSPVKNAAGEPVYVVAICLDITERKLAELEQKRFLALCENSTDFIGIATPEGKGVYVNPAGRNMVGLADLEEVRQTNMMDYFTEEDQAFVKEVILPAQWQTGNWNGEFRFRNLKTGQSIPVYYNQFVVKDPDSGEILGLATVSPDISKRKQAEEALKESEARFRSMAEASGILIAQINENGKAVYYNKEWTNLTGLEAEYLLQHDWSSLVHPDDRPGFIEAYKNAFDKKEVLKHEFRLLNKAAEYRWQLAIASPRFGSNGTFAGYISSCIDITDQKAAQAELKKFKLMSDYAFDAFILMREDGTFAYLNDLALQRWGYTREESLNIRVPDVDPIYQEDKFNEVFALAQKQGALPPFETLHKRKDGTIYPVEVSMGGITLEGKPHMFAVARDITERKQSEEILKKRNTELLRINNDLDNFIYTASHDLKAPITNIEGLVEVLIEDLPPAVIAAPETGSVINLIKGSIARFRNTVNDLTELTKLQRDAQDDVSQVQLPDIFEEIYLDLANAIQHSKAEFEVDFRQGASLQFSRKNMRSILYNLVSNAIKYHSPDRKPLIRITSQIEKDYVVLTVADNGLGMNLKQENKIFGMFKRLHDHVEGSGIGLYIVKKIVEDSQGKIEVESQVGRGTTFKVFFPAKI
ncbi:PAS domain S-box protein [Adhaeribacter aquaticus]|uniref:PAS domain S-box protein n=1 Tax=Adhaeribacter aquaticus TaxID=299567 RepID=UPI00040397BA|nr:PAS domain S-box protein [Adhaeribacter aquaticus]